MCTIQKMQTFDFIVIGAGPAGGAAAMELASSAPSVSIALMGAEAYPPYERPPLSKSVLRESAPGQVPSWLFGGDGALADAGVSLLLGDAVVDVDVSARRVVTASGKVFHFGKLLFATGASAKSLALPGFERPGVMTLRTFDDATAISTALARASTRRLTVVGGGFIGLELAATARKLDFDVTVIETGSRILSRAVPESVSSALHAKFLDEGVQMLVGRGIAAAHGDSQVREVELADGERIATSLVVVGIGASPNDQLARAAGLVVDNGIWVDELGMTSDSSCYAAGDVARRPAGIGWLPGHRCRLEAWEPALEHGRAVARAMAGMPASSPTVPWVWSEMFDWNLQMVGHGELADRTVVRPGRNASSFVAFQLCGERLVGAISVNEGRLMAPLKRALASEVSVNASSLADPAIALRTLLSPQRAEAGA
jgi:3-phenylpropionate/trans-cinnamate dioxygenase ferredoxin reductase subunit